MSFSHFEEKKKKAFTSDFKNLNLNRSIDENKLHGTIPTEFGSLAHLEYV